MDESTTLQSIDSIAGSETVPQVADTEMAVEEADTTSCGDTPMVAPLDLMAIVNRDVRAARFLVDLLGGHDADEAVRQNFPSLLSAGVDSGDGGGETMARAVEEAEQRGYLRGLNEKARAEMVQPPAYEELPPPQVDRRPATAPLIGSSARQSIWDIE